MKTLTCANSNVSLGKTQSLKFAGYRSWEQLYDSRKSIAETQPYIRIYEDITKTTNELAYKARECRHQGCIHHTRVYGGKVFIRIMCVVVLW